MYGGGIANIIGICIAFDMTCKEPKAHLLLEESSCREPKAHLLHEESYDMTCK